MTTDRDRLALWILYGYRNMHSNWENLNGWFASLVWRVIRS